MKEIKMWLDLRGEKLLSLFQLVPGPGIEPGRPKTGDFKALAVSVTLHSFLPNMARNRAVLPFGKADSAL